MIKIETADNVIYTTVSGTLDKEDIIKQFDAINFLLASHEKLRWYYEMVDFDGWDISSFTKDVTDSLKHTNDFSKIAMVGEKKWQDAMAKVSKFLTPAEVRYFDLDQREEARDWINS